MIPLSTALNCLALLDEGSLRIAVSSAIFAGQHVGAVGVRDAQPEDVFIPVLSTPDAPRRATVVAGCRDVCVRFYAALSELAAGGESGEKELAEASEHFSALLGVTKPPELAAQVRSLLEVALDPAIDTTIREPLVRLAVTYAAIDARPEYWQDHVQGDRIPGQAFQALRRIDPRNPRLEGFLTHLWHRSLRGELSLRVPFYVQAWAKEQVSSEEAIRRVLRATLSAAPCLREALNADCIRYQHSKAWSEYLPVIAVSAQPRTIKRFSSKTPVSIPPTADANYYAITAWLDRLDLVVKTPGERFEPNLARIVLPEFSAESFETIIPGGFPMSHHFLSIRNPTDVTSDEVVKTTLKRIGTNLVAQIGMTPLQQNRKARA